MHNMKAKFLPLLLACFFVFSFAKSQTVRTFESMGYDDAFIQGITGSISYFIKISPDDDVDNSKLVLSFTASQVLNPANSFIVISMRDVPVYTQRITVTPTDTAFIMEVPLNRRYLQPDGRFIKLKISTKASIGDEYCKDVDNPAVWISIKNRSYVSVNTQSSSAYQRSLVESIQEYTSIYTPSPSTLNDLKAGGVMYALLKGSNARKEIYTGMYTPYDSLPQGVLVGTADKLPEVVRQNLPSLSAGQGLICLLRIPTFQGLRSVMIITGADEKGYEKAINILSNNKRLSGAFSERMIIDEAAASSSALDNRSPLITTLESIGGNPSLMEGIGALRTKYTFSLTEFNAIPDRLIFHLESYFSVLKPDDRGFINVYLNQNLVYNSNLANRTNFIEDIELKPYLLSKFNTLEVEFRFHPGNNICKDGFSNFFAFVNVKTSTLTFSGEKENRFYSFFNFPAEFRKTPTKIIVSPGLLSSNLTSSMGELFYQLNAPISANYSRLIIPPLFSSDKISMDDIKGYSAIALLTRLDPFMKNFPSMPVQYNRDFQLYKDAKGKPTYSVRDFSNSGMAQIFREKGSTILVVTSLGEDSTNKDAFVSVIKNFGTQLTEIESNVCFANSNGISNNFFKIPEDSDIVSYGNNNDSLENFWYKYRFIILAVLLAIIVFAFFFVRNKVKESQATFKDL